jgi:hypothetical protein
VICPRGCAPGSELRVTLPDNADRSAPKFFDVIIPPGVRGGAPLAGAAPRRVKGAVESDAIARVARVAGQSFVVEEPGRKCPAPAPPVPPLFKRVLRRRLLDAEGGGAPAEHFFAVL